MLIDPTRSAPDVLAATVKLTAAFDVPDAPAVMVMYS